MSDPGFQACPPTKTSLQREEAEWLPDVTHLPSCSLFSSCRQPGGANVVNLRLIDSFIILLYQITSYVQRTEVLDRLVK
jgi:hypothetical protein